MNSMNISELAKGVATSTGSSEADAKKAITAVFDQIADAAAKGDEVSIPGFGKFAVNINNQIQISSSSSCAEHQIQI